MTKFVALSSEILDDLVAMRQFGRTYPEIANQLLAKNVSVHPRTVGKWIRRIKQSDQFNGQDIAEDISVEIKRDNEINALKVEAKHYKALYQKTLLRGESTELLVETIKSITRGIPVVSIAYKKPQLSVTSPQTVVAPICDAHIGEYVDSAQMGGLNKYDMEIFDKRLMGWTEQVINLVSLRRTYAPISRLVVPMLGDMVSGEILAELTQTNTANIVNQVAQGAYLLAQSLMTLAPHFERIDVFCVVGNHGRMTMRPPAKNKWVNWDYLLYQWVAAFCQQQENIKFVISKSFLHIFDAEGKKVLMMHGDSIKMWQGIPYYGIAKAIAQLRQAVQFKRGLEEDFNKTSGADDGASLSSSYFDYVLLGHFHTQDEIDIGTGQVIVCACIKGGDEYSFSHLHTLSRPKQLLLYFHPKYGLIGKDVIYLEKYTDSGKTFKSVLPNTWVNVC